MASTGTRSQSSSQPKEGLADPETSTPKIIASALKTSLSGSKFPGERDKELDILLRAEITWRGRVTVPGGKWL